LNFENIVLELKGTYRLHYTLVVLSVAVVLPICLQMEMERGMEIDLEALDLGFVEAVATIWKGNFFLSCEVALSPRELFQRLIVQPGKNLVFAEVCLEDPSQSQSTPELRGTQNARRVLSAG
jgi:hypothetical protein